jgi:protein O-GlcNAc transferase
MMNDTAQLKSSGVGDQAMAAQFGEAVAFHQAGMLAEAEALYRKLLAQYPHHFDGMHMLGVIEFQHGRHQTALDLIDRAIAINATAAAAHNNRGVVLQALRRTPEALASYEQAIRLAPSYVDAQVNRGNVLKELKRFEEALASYDRAVSFAPSHAGAFSSRGIVLIELQRYVEAAASCDRAIALKPDDAQAFNNRGVALAKLDRRDEALASYDSAIALNPGLVDAYDNRGQMLCDLQRFEEALASFDRAIAIDSDRPDLFHHRGRALAGLRRIEEELASYDRAIALQPDYADAYNSRGNALIELQRYREALASYDRAVAIEPNNVQALYNRGNAQCLMKRFDEAVESYDRATALDKDLAYLAAARLYAKMHACDWAGFWADCDRLAEAVDAGAASQPFMWLATPLRAAVQLKCARRYSHDQYPRAPTPLWNGERYGHDRIRLAYVSGDLHDHATAYLMAGLFEHHDRSRFETIAVSFGPAPDSLMRRRLTQAFDRFLDVRAQSDQAVAQTLRDLEVDIAVDLKGFTQDARTGIFAKRSAPVQVNYLGYPGTMGADYFDYIVADRIVLPEDQRANFSEQVVYLPDSYQVNDATRQIAASASRAEAGLPECGFVFCSFNNCFKITPDVFDVWMRLLNAIEGSVLWLFAGNAVAPRNLRHEAERRGVDAERLIFAPQLAHAEHLARHRHADLFLDTIYCNAHTTASDALWAGLPVLTCMGETFTSRVAGSLLTAVGLPELITHSLPGYEALALALARDPVRLAGLHKKLADNLKGAPLFDTARYTRHIEAAYVTMWERAERGEPPQAFAVAPIGSASR